MQHIFCILCIIQHQVGGAIHQRLILCEQQTFDPYGNGYAKAGSAQSTLGYTGEQTDSNGFVFLRARYYQPGMGRFTQMDPSRQERNAYQYGLGNPVNKVDPSGLSPVQNAMQEIVLSLPTIVVSLWSTSCLQQSQTNDTQLWVSVTTARFGNVRLYLPLRALNLEPGGIKTLANNIGDAIQRYNTRLATVNSSFESFIGLTDLIIVDALENYLPGTDPDWYALHSVKPASRQLAKYPDWVKRELAGRLNDPIIFFEKDHMIVNTVRDGTALVMHELAHKVARTGIRYGRWDFWGAASLYGPNHINDPLSYRRDFLSVQAASQPIWWEYDADYIADWAFDNNPDAWQDALMKCFMKDEDQATCQADFQRRIPK